MLGDTNLRPTVDRTLLHKGVKFNLEMVRVRCGPSDVIAREVVRHPGAVIILPIVGERVVMIRTWRLSVESWLWELPAGTMAPPESALECARRELGEETGYQAATLEPLIRFHTSPGLSDEVMHAFVARNPLPGRQHPEADERIEVRLIAWKECLAMVDRGEISDAKTQLVLLTAHRRGLLEGP